MSWENIPFIGDEVYTEQQLNQIFDNHSDFSRLIKRIHSSTKNPQTRMDLHRMIKNYEAAWFELWKVNASKNKNNLSRQRDLEKAASFYLEVKANLEQWLMVARLER